MGDIGEEVRRRKREEGSRRGETVGLQQSLAAAKQQKEHQKRSPAATSLAGMTGRPVTADDETELATNIETADERAFPDPRIVELEGELQTLKRQVAAREGGIRQREQEAAESIQKLANEAAGKQTEIDVLTNEKNAVARGTRTSKATIVELNASVESLQAENDRLNEAVRNWEAAGSRSEGDTPPVASEALVVDLNAELDAVRAELEEVKRQRDGARGQASTSEQRAADDSTRLREELATRDGQRVVEREQWEQERAGLADAAEASEAARDAAETALANEKTAREEAETALADGNAAWEEAKTALASEKVALEDELAAARARIGELQEAPGDSRGAGTERQPDGEKGGTASRLLAGGASKVAEAASSKQAEAASSKQAEAASSKQAEAASSKRAETSPRRQHRVRPTAAADSSAKVRAYNSAVSDSGRQRAFETDPDVFVLASSNTRERMKREAADPVFKESTDGNGPILAVREPRDGQDRCQAYPSFRMPLTPMNLQSMGLDRVFRWTDDKTSGPQPRLVEPAAFALAGGEWKCTKPGHIRG